MALARPLPVHHGEPEPALGWRAQWRFIGTLSGVMLLLTVVPVLVAAALTPARSIFTGYLVIARDAFVYQALWRAGAHGAWLFHPLYSSEPEPGILIYPWYLWTGHVAGAVSGPWLYHAARLGAGLALLAAIWMLATTLYRPRRLRQWAVILASLGGGVGPLLGSALHLGPIPLRPTETLVSGTSAADMLSMAPHLAWAGALLCWTFVAALRWSRTAGPRSLAGGLAAGVGLELIYPQLALLSLLTLAGWAATRRQRRPLVFVCLSAAVLAPYLLYLAWAQSRFPSAFVGVGATAQVPYHFDPGDPFGFIVLSHLVATVLIAIAVLGRRLRGDLILPAAWIVTMTAFMFLPGLRAVVGRSYLASSIPFGILAATGLAALLRRVPRGAWRRRVLLLTLAGSSLFGVYSLAQPFAIALQRLDPRAEYERAGEAALLRWLAPKSSPSDLVLTTYLDGVFVPAQTYARAYVGHPDQTADVVPKADRAVAFFEKWGVDQRDGFLESNGITYVLAQDETTAGRLRDDPHLRAVQHAYGETLYQVAW